MKGRILIIAGSDPSGGAGIQADIKTVTALGGYAATAITSLTVQNTLGVTAVHPVSQRVIVDQINAVVSDIGVDAVKIGMIGNIDAARGILGALESVTAPIILDPVLAATSGDALASEDLVGFLLSEFMPKTFLVTPNIPEAEKLTSLAIKTEDHQLQAGRRLVGLGAHAALVKGGHLVDPVITDILVTGDQEERFAHDRIETTSTHGTGCTLASAIATAVAQGMDLRGGVSRAISYLQKAIKTAPGYGDGAGPVNHTVSV